MPRAKQLELRFPSAGVVRRPGFRDSSDLGPPYPAPWAINVRAEDPLSRRLRGGSRPGLTKVLANVLGTAVAGILPLDKATSSATDPALAVLADQTLGVLVNGTLSTPAAELLDTTGGTILDTTGGTILTGTASVPAAAFLVSRYNKVYAIHSTGVAVLDVNTGNVDALAASNGTLPSGATWGFVYRDRLGLAVDNAVYLSRQGDFTDWNLGYDVEDAGRPFLLQLSEASHVGAAPTAAVPFKDAACLLATRNSLWVLSGDPAATGSLRAVSKAIGIVNERAWCKIEDAQVGDALVRDGVCFLSPRGMFLVSPSGDGLLDLSGDRIPDELQDVAATTTVRMAYCPKEQGIYIFTETAESVVSNWFFSLSGKSFWPDAWQADHQPLDACYYDGEVLTVGADFYLRSIEGDDDDGTDIESHVLIGPLRLARPGTFGRVQSLRAALGETSGTVTWRLVDGDTAEEAAENAKTAIALYQAGNVTGAGEYVAASGDLLAGRNTIVYPRIRAEWILVWLQSTAKWAYETMIIETEQSGRVR
jgi:hypothetical protein